MTPLAGLLWPPSDEFIYALAFLGLWHLLGLPPIIEIGRWLRQRRPRRGLPGRLKLPPHIRLNDNETLDD